MVVSNREQIKPGDTFERTYLGKRYTCEAAQIGNGIGFRTGDGREFKTLSTAGKYIIGTECNGYVWWHRAGEAPLRGPKPGSHNIRTLSKMLTIKGKVRASATTHTSPPLRKKATKPSAKKPIRNITLSADQGGVRPGQRRYDCLVCADSFVTTDNPPAVCPQGHEAKLPANRRRHELAVAMLR